MVLKDYRREKTRRIQDAVVAKQPDGQETSGEEVKDAGSGKRPMFLDGEMIFLIILTGGSLAVLAALAILAR